MHTTATQQKAGYLLLTSAMLHANTGPTTTLILAVRSRVADDMTLPTLRESQELIELVVYPRFSSRYEY
jgi:hypothetical protein